MADEAEIPEDGEQAAEPAPKKSKLKPALIALAGVLVLGGGAAAAYMFVGMPNGEREEVAEAPEVHFYDLPEMTVNLNTDGQDEEFLKLTVSLEVASKEVEDRIEPRVTRVVDAFQVYMRELRRSDLEGSAGIYRLKQELRRRVNLAIHPDEVDDILFKEILVQ